MNNEYKTLKREEIMEMAQEAKLMLVDGNACFMNDMATEKELLAFARLVETAARQDCAEIA